MVEGGQNSDRELNSWKSIAEYLDVTVRTAQKWEEERGMPVHRLPGGRGRVYALVSELEAWKRQEPKSQVDTTATLDSSLSSEANQGTAAHGSTGAMILGDAAVEPARFACELNDHSKGFLAVAVGRRSIRRLFAYTAVMLSLAGIAVGYWFFIQPGGPALWRVERDTLIIFDKGGRELWRKTFSRALSSTVYVSEHNRQYQLKAWFGDLDGDGRDEVLFDESPADQWQSETLHCFSEDGNTKWSFTPGRAISSDAEKFSGVFSIPHFVVAPMGRNRPNSILVVGFHRPYYPTQIALLSPRGELIRDYWHSGQIGHPGKLAIADLDNNGASEIYLGGMNNGYDQATLVVLDPDRFEGASREEIRGYQLQGFAPGRELARLLFPRSCMNQALQDQNEVSVLGCAADEIIVSVMERPEPESNSILYHLTGKLDVRKIVLSNQFINHHKQLQATGILDHSLSPEEEARFREIRFLPPHRTAGETSSTHGPEPQSN